MEIRDITTKTNFPTGRPMNKPGKAGADTESASPPSTQVSLSGASQGTLARNVSGDMPVFDAGKVEQIKAAIANGQFQVNPAKIADGLLGTVQDLLLPNRS